MDDFDDDTLDALPASALQELENNALQLTQVPRIDPVRRAPVSTTKLLDNSLRAGDEDLDDAVITNNSRMPAVRPLVDRSLPVQSQRPVPSHHRPNAGAIHPAAPTPASVFKSTAATHQRPAPSQSAHPHLSQHPPRSSQFARPALPQYRDAAPAPSQQAGGGPSGGVLTALQQRVRALEAELNSARGEVAIIRSNSTRARQEHETEVTRLKKTNAEQLLRHERLVEQAVAAERSATTELQFLQSDLREQTSKVRRAAPAAGVVVGAGGGGRGDGFGKSVAGPATPKKASKTYNVADGFDDMDFVVMSPSKGQGKTKNSGPVAVPVTERTPTKGKRKRPIFDSPVMALETHTDISETVEKVVPKVDRNLPQVRTVFEQLAAEFLPIILDRDSDRDRGPTFDVLSRYSFPSEPTTSIAAMIFKQIPLMGNPQDPLQLPLDFSEFMIDLWSRCYEEKYYEPINDICSLLSYPLTMHTKDVGPALVNLLILNAQSTIYLVANRRYRRVHGERTPEDALLEAQINSTQILKLIQLVGVACCNCTEFRREGKEKKLEEFWERISLEIVLLLLTPKQELGDILGMLELLSMPVLPGSIGPILKDKEPELVATLVIERVSAVLVYLPKGATNPTKKHMAQLQALEAILAFLHTEFGAKQLAGHANLIPRIVMTMQQMLNELGNMSLAWLPRAPARKEWFGAMMEKYMLEEEEESGQRGDQDADGDQAMAGAGAALANRSTGRQGGAGKMDFTDTHRAHGDKPDPLVLEKARLSLRDVLTMTGRRARPTDPPPASGPDDGADGASPLVAADQDFAGANAVLARCVLALHRLATHPAAAARADVRARLEGSSTVGVAQYQLVLGRLTWGYGGDEGGGGEREGGLAEETGEMAHELLELSLAPEEARGLKAFFGVEETEGSLDEEGSEG